MNYKDNFTRLGLMAWTLLLSAVLSIGAAETKTPITLSLENVELSEALHEVATEAGIVIEIPEDLAETPVTIQVVDIPWDQCLDQVLRINNLRAELRDGVWVILEGSPLGLQD